MVFEFENDKVIFDRPSAMHDHITCHDGFTMSVQASSFHYSIPRQDNLTEYSCVEVGFPSEEEELLLPYAEDAENPTETVYAYVPAAVVKAVVDKHGGLL